MEKLIAVARGDAPADLLLANAHIVNVFTGEIEEGDVALYGEHIAGIGTGYSAERTVDLQGKYLAPGMINGHTHIESSLLHVPQYARAVVPRGTTSAITDLHEVANVSGLMGIRYLMDCAAKLPLDLFFMAPSCVPATHLETSGAVLTASDIRRALRWGKVIGLGEVMNFPGVIGGDEAVLQKIRLAQGGGVGGHRPGGGGKGPN